MTELDQALETLREKPDDHQAQSGFYDRFLNGSFCVPIIEETVQNEDGSAEKKVEVPLIIENEGTDYLVFFNSSERLESWAEPEAPRVNLPGHVITEMSTSELHWAMNVGTDFFKAFAPDEISWLKDVVKRCKEETEAAEETS